MHTDSEGPRVRVSVNLTGPLRGAVAAISADERRTASATVELLVAEAIERRARAAERGQDAPPPSGRSGEPGSPGRGALRPSQGLAAQP